jgi:hypothetical protein
MHTEEVTKCSQNELFQPNLILTLFFSDFIPYLWNPLNLSPPGECLSQGGSHWYLKGTVSTQPHGSSVVHEDVSQTLAKKESSVAVGTSGSEVWSRLVLASTIVLGSILSRLWGSMKFDSVWSSPAQSFLAPYCHDCGVAWSLVSSGPRQHNRSWLYTVTTVG